MKTKYDWSDVPKEVNWIATCENGFAFGHRGKPRAGHLRTGFWYGGGDTSFVLFPRENPFKGNWRDSLEERPHEYK
ncbi:MAG: hypothetical protein KBT03_13170 [Bacteroidales bacterium]|nr:hypothetical protein [Candidatus Scybalousia scybalohippi]